MPAVSSTNRNPKMAVLVAAALLAVACDGAPSGSKNGGSKVASGKAADTPGRTPASVDDWTARMSTTPEGGYLIGNPHAPAKLVEYGSLSCTRCRDFHLQAMAALKRDYIATGAVAYEFRNYILGGADLAASMLARCDGPEKFFSRIHIFFQRQDEWSKGFSTITSIDQRRISAQAERGQLATYARIGGLEDFAGAVGIPVSRFSRCLTDEEQLIRLDSLRDEAEKYGLSDTPSFLLNDRLLNDADSWTEVRLKLDEFLNRTRNGPR